MEFFTSIRLISGHPSIYPNAVVDLTVDTNGLELKYNSGFWESKKVLISYADITGLQTDEQKERSLGKAATGAIIGGLLTGGIGLLAGAAIGGRSKNKSCLYVGYNLNGMSCVLTFQTGWKTPMIYNAIIANFHNKQL